ncbi:MAG: LysR family transcriptional regulator [Clostridia bacterium]|nr:LysR family transcriptional regulator [Clostridia bacterium]
MLINLELYRVFYVVAKTGSLTKAKQELFISQPAVSQAIKQLETQLGGKLFVRNSKGVSLTKEGVMMYEHVKVAYDEIILAEKLFSEMRGVRSGVVVISASDTIAKYLLPAHIARFKTAYPDVTIRIINRPSVETVAMLKAGKADVGLINDAGDFYDDNVLLTPFMTVRECLVCSPDFYEKNLKDVGVLQAKDLISYPLIMLESKSATRSQIERCIVRNGGKVRTTFELCSIDLIIEYAKIGLGIGCVTREFARRDLENGSLVEIKTDFDFDFHQISVATYKGTTPSFAVKTFVENMLKRKY